VHVVSTGQVLAFGLAALIIIAIPGPSVLFTIGRALAYGRTVALLSVVGNSLGLFVVMVLVSLGLGAVLPQFVDRGAGNVPAQMLALGSLAFLIGLLSDGAWALVASRMREWINASADRGRALGTVGGLSMIGLGVALAVTGRPE
jgi:threonine/homoserine/homoserine lactone efflux protein